MRDILFSKKPGAHGTAKAKAWEQGTWKVGHCLFMKLTRKISLCSHHLLVPLRGRFRKAKFLSWSYTVLEKVREKPNLEATFTNAVHTRVRKGQFSGWTFKPQVTAGETSLPAKVCSSHVAQRRVTLAQHFLYARPILSTLLILTYLTLVRGRCYC
jgi:hypothetical protein